MNELNLFLKQVGWIDLTMARPETRFDRKGNRISDPHKSSLFLKNEKIRFFQNTLGRAVVTLIHTQSFSHVDCEILDITRTRALHRAIINVWAERTTLA